MFRGNSIHMKIRGGFSLKKIIHALICIEFFLILLHFFLFLRTNNHYRLKRVIVEGSHYINSGAIVNSLNFLQGANIFDANLERISRTIEKNPWIMSSSAGIQYPSTLNISINEREPIAILKGEVDSAIDSEGMVLGNVPSSFKSCLPKIDGFSGKRVGVFFRNYEMNKIISILQVFRNISWFRHKCFSIKKTEDGFYLLRFRNKFLEVKISHNKLISQIARLISVLELFPNRIRVAGNRLFFDLTFPSRVIMRPSLEYGGIKG